MCICDVSPWTCCQTYKYSYGVFTEHNHYVTLAGVRSQATLSINLLSMLKTKSGAVINIIDEIAPHWSDFALKLDFDPYGGTIQIIEKKCHYDPKDCCREVMQLWLKGKGSRQPATWKLLVEILHECDLNTLAGKVRSALEFN